MKEGYSRLMSLCVFPMKQKEAPAQPPAKEGPSKKELKKLEKKAQKAENKSQPKQENGAGAKAGPHPAGAAAAAASGGAKKITPTVNTPTLYPADAESTHTVGRLVGLLVD